MCGPAEHETFRRCAFLTIETGPRADAEQEDGPRLHLKVAWRAWLDLDLTRCEVAALQAGF